MTGNATPVNAATQVRLQGGERATVRFTPDQSGSTFEVPIVAVDRHPNSTYEVVADGTTRYDQAAVPPVDTNVLQRCFFPPLEFDTYLKIIIRNADSNPHDYAVQVIGGEVNDGH